MEDGSSEKLVTAVDCSNCKKILDNEDEILKELNALSSSEDNNFSSDVQIVDVLAYIYGIQWDRLFMDICHEEEKKYNSEDESFKVLLCSRCAVSLTILYKAYLDFENLTSSDSLIKKAKEFRFKTAGNWYSNLKSHDTSGNQHSNEEKLFDSFNFDVDSQSDFGENESECKYNPEESPLPETQYTSVFCNVRKSTRTTRSTSKFTSAPPGKRMVVKLEKIPDDELPRPRTIKSQYRRKNNSSKRKASVSHPSSMSTSEKRRKKRRDPLGQQDLSCPECKKEFGSAKNLWKHRQIHRKDRLVQCDICGKVLSSKKYMEKHRKNHRDDRAVNCEICGKLLASKEAIKMHNLRVHISETEKEMQKKPCEICGKMVLANNKSHMLTHTQEREKFKCDKCNKVFYTKERLDLHLEAHESTQIFKCSICNREFPIQKYLDEHHERHHNSAKPFGCDQCPRRFADKCHLERHILTHSTDRPFICEECGNTFRSQRHLKQHIKCHRDEELGAEAFKCPHCGKFLRNSWSLYRHTTKFHRSDLVLAKRVHECTICGRRLFDEKNLKKHYAAVHKSLVPETIEMK